MNLTGNKAQSSGATKELLLRWSETKNSWRDAKSREFGEKYLDELTARVAKTMTIIDKLEAVLQKVHHDCD
jgi:hypothetical protein